MSLKRKKQSPMRERQHITGDKWKAPWEKYDRVRTISNSNWTEWRTIQGATVRVISKSDEREDNFLDNFFNRYD